MTPTAFVNNPDLYWGEYVAVKSFTDREVVSHGEIPLDVVNEAKEKGFKEPVLLFIPEKGMLNVY
jgi:hypothetical protein